MSGLASAGEGERTWSFRPDLPWQAGAHTLGTEAGLEDLARNSLLRVFDTDLLEDWPAPAADSSVRIEGYVR